MTKFASGPLLLASGVLALVSALGGPATAQSVPNLQPDPGGWTHPFGGVFPPAQGSPSPVLLERGHPGRYRFGDASNPNLKPWAKDLMKKDNDEVDAGKIPFSAHASCMPHGVPLYLLAPGPFYILQTPGKVVIMEEQSQRVRQIYLNVPHSANPKPTGYGESVGRYEGDTLVVDTIAQDPATAVDSVRTPHTDRLHVVERWHVVDGGKALEVDITVDDPDTFYQPWKTYQRYERGAEPLTEFICAENNQILFDYHTPVADKPDF